MDPFVKMDIFFFVTTLCVLILTALVSFAVWRLLRILRHVEHIAQVAGKEAENIREDAAYVRGRVLGALDGMFAFIPRRRKKAGEKSSDAS